MEIKEKFYREISEILESEHTYKPWLYGKPSRWNNRAPGNGRYIGRGSVRMFSENLIIVSLRSPRLTAQYKSAEDAIAAIKFAIYIQQKV